MNGGVRLSKTAHMQEELDALLLRDQNAGDPFCTLAFVFELPGTAESAGTGMLGKSNSRPQSKQTL